MAGRYFLLSHTPRRTSFKRERNFSLSDMTEEEVIKEFGLKRSEIGYTCSLLQDSVGLLRCRSIDLLLEQNVLRCLKLRDQEVSKTVAMILSTFLSQQ